MSEFYSKILLSFLICSGFILLQNTGWAQDATARYEINAKRIGVSFTDKDALPRGREFVRLDSTYYVGWLYQGLFLNDRSADRNGYQRALPFMRTAFNLLEKDFTPALQTLYNSTDLYVQNNVLYVDYINIARALRECYEYIDMPDSAMWVLTQVEKKQFRRDEFGLYGTKAWLIHRNRFYTDGRYGFLQNNVTANANLALQSCYDGFANIRRNEAQNSEWFGPFSAEMDKHYLYHYLAMIHSYMQQYDSSEYYYNLMAEMGTISWNNYGSLKHEIGDFASANQLYGLDKMNDAGDKRLREPYYYLPLLSLYSGNTTEAMTIAKEALGMWQSMPGFGWYNIALGRSYLYNGQLDSADIALTKAANFKEVHIGTTLTQPQYEFTISLLRLVWYSKKIAAIKFANKGWWYRPTLLYEIVSLSARRYADKYVLANQLAENPERQRLIYDLFCGESTVSFDEIYTIMGSFSPKYFSRLLEDKTDIDPRLNIKKYFQLGQAKMLYEAGKTRKAKASVEGLLNTMLYDPVHEKLFLARVYELQAVVSEGAEKQEALNKMYALFPQLIPFSNQKMSMALQVSGEDAAVVNKVYEQLQKTNVHWVDVATREVPAASIYIQKNGNKYEITMDTRSAGNEKIVTNEKMIVRSTDNISEELLLRLFGKAGTLEPDLK
jgi:hypothetical protein